LTLRHCALSQDMPYHAGSRYQQSGYGNQESDD
jgi:hypothetical protein